MTLTSLVNDVKSCVNLYLPALAHQAYKENDPGSQGLFCFMLIHISHGIKYQFLKKIYDVINKVYTFKFENLDYFYRFSIAVYGNGNQISRFSI